MHGSEKIIKQYTLPVKKISIQGNISPNRDPDMFPP